MRHMHIPKAKKNTNIIQINIDITTLPSQERKYCRLKNKVQVFEDRRFKKPKYKTDYRDY